MEASMNRERVPGLFFMLVLGGLLAGCGAYAWEPLAGRSPTARRRGYTTVQAAEARSARDAQLLAAADRVDVLQGSAEQPTEVVGFIDAHSELGNEDEALRLIRLRAAELGADAVIHVEFHHARDLHEDADGDVDEGAAMTESGDVDADVDEGEGGNPLALHLSGTAVRYRDLIQGRHFVVIGQVVVHEAMTDEARALRDLTARARAMHADMVIGIHFRHGHGEAPVEVRGTAIRFDR